MDNLFKAIHCSYLLFPSCNAHNNEEKQRAINTQCKVSQTISFIIISNKTKTSTSLITPSTPLVSIPLSILAIPSFPPPLKPKIPLRTTSPPPHPSLSSPHPRKMASAFLSTLPTIPTPLASTTCPICLEEITTTTTTTSSPPPTHLPCTHTLHTPCIAAWLTSHNTCPLCGCVLFPLSIPAKNPNTNTISTYRQNPNPNPPLIYTSQRFERRTRRGAAMETIEPVRRRRVRLVEEEEEWDMSLVGMLLQDAHSRAQTSPSRSASSLAARQLWRFGRR